MNIGKEIPDLPADDYRFMVTIMVDGHGRPSQLENEIRNTLERMLWNEFGEMATVTLVMRTTDDTPKEGWIGALGALQPEGWVDPNQDDQSDDTTKDV